MVRRIGVIRGGEKLVVWIVVEVRGRVWFEVDGAFSWFLRLGGGG